MRRWLKLIAAGQSVRRLTRDAGLHALAGLADFLPGIRQRLAAVELIEDRIDARPGGETQRLDRPRPAGPGPHPVIVYLHGGAFAIGSKRTHRALAAASAARGDRVCNVDYRLAPQPPCPAAVEDACAAWPTPANRMPFT